MFENPKRLGKKTFLYENSLSSISDDVLKEIGNITSISPLRKMLTRRGLMSAEMTNCGDVGWITDRKGYRYTRIDPLTDNEWPDMPGWLRDLAVEVAEKCGFYFTPNVCLINLYYKGTKLGLHVDEDEGDVTQPIVSFSFGAPAIFKWGGLNKTDKAENITLKNGDVLVWGGEDRLRYHGISKVGDKTGGYDEVPRYCLTFRYAKVWQET